MKAIVNATVLIDGRWRRDTAITFDRQIVSIGALPPGEIQIIDAKGHYVSAGFIDLHIHGSGGSDVMDATPQALQTISRTLVRTGTTSFLATTMSAPKPQIEAAVEAVRGCLGRLDGAEVLGVHLEGPFLNPRRCGAQNKSYLTAPDREWFERFSDIVRMVTVAPEIENGFDFIRYIKKRYEHIVCALGHSDATYAEALKGFDAGATHTSHLFNAMAPYHHRKPGLVGACFDREESTCDIIADTVHTHPHHLRLAYRMKRDRLALITDAMRAGCLKEGLYELGGQRVKVDASAARLEDGTLAGSVLAMNEAVANMVRETDMTLKEALYAASTLPAEILGVAKGRIECGYDADLVIFDQNCRILTTIVSGEVVYVESF